MTSGCPPRESLRMTFLNQQELLQKNTPKFCLICALAIIIAKLTQLNPRKNAQIEKKRKFLQNSAKNK